MKALASAVIAASLAATAVAAAPPEAPRTRTLTVTGTGIVKGAPDEASFSTGVVTQAPSAAAALAANSRAMAAVLAALKRRGVPDQAIQTANLSLSPQYASCKPGAPCEQRISGYEASNTVAVTLPLDKAGTALDALAGAGANQIGGIAFAIHDPKPLLGEARAAAVKDAIDKASVYAKAAGVGLGPILAIQEGGSDAPRPMFKAMARFPDQNVPLAAGEESVSASVSITWLIN